MRAWLACAGGNPIVALAGKLAPLFAIFFVIMLTVPLILEGLLGISFKGDVPMMVVAAVAADRRLPGAGSADAAPGARPRDRARAHRPHRLARIRLRRRRISSSRHERVCVGLGRDPAACAGTWRCCSGRRRAGLPLSTPRGPLPRWRHSPCSTRCSRFCACARSREVRPEDRRKRSRRHQPPPRRAASAEPSSPSGGACSRPAAPSSCW